MKAIRYLSSLAMLFCLSLAATAQTPETINIDLNARSTPFPHFWEQSFGSGRAILSLRESYRRDLREVKKITDVHYVRFHAIFHDELGVYDEDENGNPEFNFTYVGQVYDGLLQNGVRPIVEISFMPKKLASRQDLHPFWYKQNVAPPKDYRKWDLLIHNFAKFLIDRYGIDEVSQWYFEVWNEPNIDFWSGDPKQATYFELYDHTARALKTVNARLRVGGPATSSAHWVDDFLAHVAKENVPVDFVSTHGYSDDTVQDLFGTSENIPIEQRACKAVAKVHKQILASPYPKLPLFWTEWNVSGYGELHAGDTSYSTTATAQTIHDCDGLLDILSFWTFSDVFEENGPSRQPFPAIFGLLAAGGIKKPSFYGFELFHRLGTTRIANPADNILVTRRDDGSFVIALWNLNPPDKPGAARAFDLKLQHLGSGTQVLVSRIDADHSNTLAAYQRLGRPRYVTPEQVRQLNQESELAAPESITAEQGQLHLTLPPNGFALLELSHPAGH
ncbi:MAG TPA: glycosyl hydrolase family 39 [Methylomirabilota bacterium]|nr:glycosyl hydrolase family 39 [Methylomirabilota bacterium]